MIKYCVKLLMPTFVKIFEAESEEEAFDIFVYNFDASELIDDWVDYIEVEIYDEAD